jgi:hypothetical protein
MRLQERAPRRCAGWLAALACGAAAGAHGDAGPPYLTNDPGTPGSGNWEINLGAAPTVQSGTRSWQLPQLDFNFGLGERIQLTYEIPYVVQNRDGEAAGGGWSNAYPGLKWRFFDQGEGGWQISTFPQFETAASSLSQRRGIAAAGSRLLLPVEVAKDVGPISLDFEAGYYVQGAPERIVGFVAGRKLTPRLELDAELYNDHLLGASPDVTTLDVGGRFRLHRGFILLFMAGRSLAGNGPGQTEFMGYLGVQILLSDYGRSLEKEP